MVVNWLHGTHDEELDTDNSSKLLYDIDDDDYIDRMIELEYQKKCDNPQNQIKQKRQELEHIRNIFIAQEKKILLEIKELEGKIALIDIDDKQGDGVCHGSAWRKDVVNKHILSLFNQGKSRTQIAKIIGCSYNTVTNRLRGMGIPI